MKTLLFTITAFYVLTPVLTVPRRRQNVMALRETSRFRSCCFVDIFCFTVCFHSGDRTRNEFAAGERLQNIRHLVRKRKQFASKGRTNQVTAGQIKNIQNMRNIQNPSPFDTNEQFDAITNQRHTHRHRHHHAERSKRSTSLLWNKLRFVN